MDFLLIMLGAAIGTALGAAVGVLMTQRRARPAAADAELYLLRERVQSAETALEESRKHAVGREQELQRLADEIQRLEQQSAAFSGAADPSGVVTAEWTQKVAELTEELARHRAASAEAARGLAEEIANLHAEASEQKRIADTALARQADLEALVQSMQRQADGQASAAVVALQAQIQQLTQDKAAAATQLETVLKQASELAAQVEQLNVEQKRAAEVSQARQSELETQLRAERAQIQGEAGATIAALQSQVDSEQHRSRELTALVQRLQEDQRGLAAQLSTVQGQASGLAAQVQQLLEEKLSAAAQVQELEAQAAGLSSQVRQLTEEKTASAAQVESIAQEASNLAVQVRQLTEEKTAAAAQVESIAQEASNLAVQVQQLTEEKTAAAAQLESIAQEASNLAVQVQQLTEEKTAAAEQLQALEQQAAGLAEQVRQLTEEKAATALQVGALEQQAADLAAQVQQAETEKSAALAELTAQLQILTEASNETASESARSLSSLQIQLDTERRQTEELTLEIFRLRAEVTEYQEKLAEEKQSVARGVELLSLAQDKLASVFAALSPEAHPVPASGNGHGNGNGAASPVVAAPVAAGESVNGQH